MDFKLLLKALKYPTLVFVLLGLFFLVLQWMVENGYEASLFAFIFISVFAWFVFINYQYERRKDGE